MTSEQRSRCMSRIRSAKTKPEMLLRRALWSKGLRFRVKSRLPGRPDIIFTRAKLAVFVDGCFWHSCPVHGTAPKSNQSYWDEKLASNRARDERVTSQIASMGWHCLRIWEHEIKGDLMAVVQSVTLRRAALLEQHRAP
ncbi:very short patch repair endonuclease [Sphingomonas paucimobilis]|uniref:very short patch repair endonuclease n=1 Tax=Sphingomonas paucimobilis TaxID=13689 RepID=UPI000DE44822|nr:very short patch repair endonuclease [Sphingomonas paucimobilis]QBE92499.1 very short patch repair endonuclease [Sphingomonas paucimobilis]